MPEDLSSTTTAADVRSPVTTEIVSSRPSADMTVRKVSTPKRSAAESWAAWRATGSAASANSFCVSVSSWLEGASAQLVRPLWPAGGIRPTLTNVQDRLRDRLALVLTGEPDYVKALEVARRHVAQELNMQRARDLGG